LLNFDKILEDTSKIPGWSSQETRKILMDLATNSFSRGFKLVVEVGTWEGRTAIPIALCAKEHSAQLICVDPYLGFEMDAPLDAGDGYPGDGFVAKLPRHRFIDRLQTFGVYSTVDLRPSPSNEVAYSLAENPKLPPISLVYIDGAHENGDCFRDLCIWANLVSPEGYLVVHDAHTHALPISKDVKLWFDRQTDWYNDVDRGRNIQLLGGENWWKELYVFKKGGVNVWP